MISRVINGKVVYSTQAKGCRLISLVTLPECHLIFLEKLERKIKGDCSQHMFRCIYQNLDYFSHQVKSYLMIFYYQYILLQRNILLACSKLQAKSFGVDIFVFLSSLLPFLSLDSQINIIQFFCISLSQM